MPGSGERHAGGSGAPVLRPPLWACLVTCCLSLGWAGCRTVETNDLNERLLPSNFRDWSPELSVLPIAEYDQQEVTLHNVRNCTYLTESDFVVDHYTATYNLDELESVDFIVVPFRGLEFMAHTMLSFGFRDGRYVAVSAEIRTERGEKYSPVLGITRQFEITYVVADERDLIRLRTRHRDADVYVYRTMATPEQGRRLFLDVMRRVNELAERPEFYDTFANNCTTNLAAHVNRIAPQRVPYTWRVLLPGFSDRYAYDLGLLDTSVPFETLKRQALINDLAERHYDDPDFSQRIRRHLTRPRQGNVPPGTLPLDTLPLDTLPLDTLPLDTLPPGTLPLDALPTDDAPTVTASPATTAQGGNDPSR